MTISPGPCKVDGCPVGRVARDLCRKHYTRFMKYGTTSDAALSRFAEEVPLADRVRSVGYTVTATGCHEWNGARNSDGYGYLNYKRKTVKIHRYIVSLRPGGIPEGLSVLHHCDNPPCFNDAHLFVGTTADNVADMIAKGRQYTPQRRTHCKRGHEMDEENTRLVGRSRVRRQCRACDRLLHRERRAS